MDKDCSTRKRDNYWCTYPASLFTALEVPSDPAKVVVMVIADSLGHLRLNLAITKLFEMIFLEHLNLEIESGLYQPTIRRVQ